MQVYELEVRGRKISAASEDTTLVRTSRGADMVALRIYDEEWIGLDSVSVAMSNGVLREVQAELQDTSAVETVLLADDVMGDFTLIESVTMQYGVVFHPSAPFMSSSYTIGKGSDQMDFHVGDVYRVTIGDSSWVLACEEERLLGSAFLSMDGWADPDPDRTYPFEIKRESYSDTRDVIRKRVVHGDLGLVGGEKFVLERLDPEVVWLGEYWAEVPDAVLERSGPLQVTLHGTKDGTHIITERAYPLTVEPEGDHAIGG